VSSVRTTLPVIDLSDEALGERLRSVAHAVGFFYLTGHGVPDGLTDRLLTAARALFALPQADKDAVAMVKSPHFRGYTRLGGELTGGVVDWREQLDVGPEREPLTDPAEAYLRLQGQPVARWAARASGRRRGMGCRARGGGAKVVAALGGIVGQSGGCL
jgi:isopenicillin N synthase-like dioxygenase